MWEFVHERGFRSDWRDPIGNDTRLSVDTAKVVPDIVAKEEHGLKAHLGTSNWADIATFLEPSLP